MHTIHGQYTMLITPFIFAAAIVGLERARRWGPPRTAALLALYLCIGMVEGAERSPLFSQQPAAFALPAGEAAEARRILAQIPADASVSTQVALLSHVSHRRQVYLIPNPFEPWATGPGIEALRQLEGQADAPYTPTQWRKAISASTIRYIVLCPKTSPFVLRPDIYSAFTDAAVRSSAYGIVTLGQDVLVLQRGADHRQGLRLLEQRSGVRVRNDTDVEKAFWAWTGGYPH